VSFAKLLDLWAINAIFLIYRYNMRWQKTGATAQTYNICKGQNDNKINDLIAVALTGEIYFKFITFVGNQKNNLEILLMHLF